MMKAEITKSLQEDPLEFSQALDRSIMKRFSLYQEGVRQYQTSKKSRVKDPKQSIWANGSASLRDYGTDGQGDPVFVIPSLVNRYYILDLMQDSSFLGWLENQRWHPYVMDWGAPGGEEAEFGLEDYIVEYLQPALEQIATVHGKPPIVVGYCMGGTLAMALSILRSDLVRAQVLLASPWDFHEGQEELGSAILQGKWLASLLPLVEAQGGMQSDILQALFASLDPTLSLRKFSGLRNLDPNSQRAQTFIALEDWLNDGVPLTKKVAQECFSEWYGDNVTGKGQWTVGGQLIQPAKAKMPVLSVISNRDRIVPKLSSQALANNLVNNTTIETSFGHIGMITSRGAQLKVWVSVGDWMKQIAL